MVGVPTLVRVTGSRYVVPLREGGSLPAVVDTETGDTYVVKFRGAGQGPKALIAEALVAAIGLAVGLPVPMPAVVDLEDGFGRGEPDPEIQDLLQASIGENFGLEFLPGALAFDPAVDSGLLLPELAADIVWLDAYVTNVDRTARNTNLLVCNQQVWLIDHGAALFMHHRWSVWRERIQSPFPQIGEHVLLPFAGDLAAADTRLRPKLELGLLAEVVQDVPEAWFGTEAEFADTQAQRAAYVTYLSERLNGPRTWLAEAIAAQKRGPKPLALRQTHRVV
ncbi:MAG: aminotransferase class I and II [Chloroflexi bacterium]|nr:aminotransferase class I and II [Chloroflexota bacterium]